MKSESIARALSSVELRFNVKILRLYSDNHTALRENSLGPEMREFKALYVKEEEFESDLSILTIHPIQRKDPTQKEK